MKDTFPLLVATDFPPIRRDALHTLQANLGYRCNQSCIHCHVAASPKRTEAMSSETIDTLLKFAERQGIKTLDLTGGAPELNPHFRRLISEATDMGLHVMDRCNLTILSEPGQETLANFLAGHKVEVVASLPCYLEENVDAQRGKGIFERSIDGLKQLNALGYGDPGSGLELNLVYNPIGATLPPDQQQLEKDYKAQLHERYGIRFNHLFTLTNMPIQRFGSQLISNNEFHDYMRLLKDAYLDANLQSVMCRQLISVDWEGFVYDCDFNQMLKMNIGSSTAQRVHLSELLDEQMNGRPIHVADHCYGCTAGQGSSCGGALAAEDELSATSRIG